ncbi:saccharopine dehydrogenase [Salipiger mucosus]|uniref:Saccharopine dehydrogenase [NAD(+), L-lysine-forming] n=1 Tax=Salipiger mucosus DSM 16094 TaxID=1123237 RepID=S9QIW8_9RHOB|nr:saccharopine dehydrogenase [Salipiger mucosus]EPX79752.1 Saccharopine dehydrogenase (NAD+, L-lysine-forming) [Salipiger mucosus DSM 16094]
MTHLWVRAEPRPNEERVGVTPEGVAALLARGFRVTVEESRARVIGIEAYRAAGAEIAPEGSWPEAPDDAMVFGLKELPEDGTPLRHRHIMFGHAYKGQAAGRVLLERFAAGGGTLYDLEYLVEPDGRRVAAFGYWAGYAGAAVTLLARAAQRAGGSCPPVSTWPDAAAMEGDVSDALARAGGHPPRALVIGALGRVGTGATDLCHKAGLEVTQWDLAETAHGGPFPEVLEHEIFLNCILARPGTPVFVPAEAARAARRLTAIGDIACDPQSDFSPVKVYDHETTWAAPVVRVHEDPPLDVMAIDNLPSLLPLESSEDFAAQLLPHLKALDAPEQGVWGRARATFLEHMPKEDG